MAVVDVNEAKAQETVAELRSKGVRSIAIKADITQAKECQRCALRPITAALCFGVVRTCAVVFDVLHVGAALVPASPARPVAAIAWNLICTV